MRRRTDEHLKYGAPEKRNYSRTPGGCTTLSNSSIDVLGQIRRIIFRTSSLALSIDPFPAEKQETSSLTLSKQARFYFFYLQNISHDFNFGQKKCPKKKPSEIFSTQDETFKQLQRS